ncbi:MAG: NAD(P)(+) transhydrogenase (Re/Si-specific) subunit beta [Chitinophagaceae bacterium]
MALNLLTICYLIASVSFILGLKMLSAPATARRGNLIAAGGMLIAIVATIFLYEEDGEKLGNYGWIFGGLLIGGIIGVMTARKVQMTAMPELVSLFNGMGGACAMLISIEEFNHLAAISYLDNLLTFPSTGSAQIATAPAYGMGHLLIILAGMIIGSVSFSGSMVAWGKLNGKVKDFAFRGQHLVNIFFLLLIVSVSAYLLFSFGGDSRTGMPFLTAKVYFYSILFLGLFYGVLFVLPIGGADMPVVISVLNSFTGVAAACGGFLYNNKAMLTGGILVGAAGTLLTILMCKAMNRSLLNVLIGSFGAKGTASAIVNAEQGIAHEVSVGDAAMLMNYATKVIIVPGYGLAVAQAQHVCHELENVLEEKGVQVKYAIHPVAGRMPGHMNVLLAEADVPYEKLEEMEQANNEFATTDVVLVLGANDVVNPAAKSDPSSPIYGMPILEVELAKHVIVNKRSMKPGYAGIENQLFFRPKTTMLFGDAKQVIQKLITEIKAI